MTKEQLEIDFDQAFNDSTRATGGGYEADWTSQREFWDLFEPKIMAFARVIAGKAYRKGYNAGSADEYKDTDTENEKWEQFCKENNL